MLLALTFGGLVAQLWPTLCDPMDCSPPGSSVLGISQARILEWVSFSRGSSQGLKLHLLSLLLARQIVYNCLGVTYDCCTNFIWHGYYFSVTNNVYNSENRSQVTLFLMKGQPGQIVEKTYFMFDILWCPVTRFLCLLAYSWTLPSDAKSALLHESILCWKIIPSFS